MAVISVPKYPNSPTLIVPGGRVVGVIYNIGTVAVQLSENLYGLSSGTAVQGGAFTDGFPLQPGDSFSILYGWDLALYASAILDGALLTVILSYPCDTSPLPNQRNAQQQQNAPSISSGSGNTAPSEVSGGSAAPLPAPPAPTSSGGSTGPRSTL
ncbi:MAG: hypothetical protein ACYDD2_13095 [Candidatus Acidiferrales bacterium]